MRTRRNQTVDCFCWCGRCIIGVRQSVVDRCETVECGRGCRARFDRDGVNFNLAGYGGRSERVGKHPLSCTCSEACNDARSDYYRHRYNAKRGLA